MRIATWNVERLKHIKDIDKLLSEIEKADADILVLAETDERIKPDYPYCYKTSLLTNTYSVNYKNTENRVSIYTKYKCIKEYSTHDRFTSICVELETEYGNLLVYGTIIGIFGNREKSFKQALEKQIEDINRLSGAGKRLCIIGDYNLSFSDDYYYTKFGRNAVWECCINNKLNIVTSHRPECIDHIALSKDFISNEKLKITSINEWNYDKSLSDHKGIVIELQPDE